MSNEALKEIIRDEIVYWQRYCNGPAKVTIPRDKEFLFEERPLCATFYPDCLLCPVAKLTGNTCCRGTRFDSWIYLHSSVYTTIRITPYGEEDDVDIDGEEAASLVAGAMVVLMEDVLKTIE